MKILPAYNNPSLTTPRESPAAVMTCGLKQAGGGMVPGSTDRFWIGLATGADKRTARKSHPAFSAFNADKKRGESPLQAFVRCLLVHSNLNDARKIDRGAYRGPKNDRRVKNPSHQGPWCSGDGTSASRWGGSKYKTIECPNLNCPFAQGVEPPCKARLSLLFYPRWDGTPFEAARMPQLLTKYVTRGRRMLESFEGMVQHARAQAESFGITIESWHGYPFAMTLSKRTAPGKRYTDVAFTADGDLLAWLQAQRERVAALSGVEPFGLLEPESNTETWAGIDQDLVSPDAVGPSIKPASVSVAPTDLQALADQASAAGVYPAMVEKYGLPKTWELNRAAIEELIQKANSK